MSRVYAREEATDFRFLLRLECDHVGCNASVKPHPEIAKSGWTKRGVDDGAGGSSVYDYCPGHS